MIVKPEYDNEEEMPIEISENPFSERTIYDVERETFKNSRKNEEIEETDWFY